MHSMDSPQLVTTDSLHDRPARFDPEDLVHLRALLGDASPRATASTNSTPERAVLQPAAAPKLTREEKQREKYRHRYRNRIAKISRLKDEVAALETTVRQLSSPDQHVGDVNNRPLTAELPLPPATSREELINYLREASILKQCLQRERAQLRHQFIESCDRWRHVHNLVAMHHKLYVVTQSSFVVVKPLAIQECAKLRQVSVKIRDTFHQRHLQLNESICGWSATRSMEDGVLSIATKKTYFSHSIDFFVPIAWRLYSDPKLYRSIFAPALEMQVRVVQQINSNNIVMLKEYVETGGNGERIKVKTLYLLTRAWTATGFLVGIHGIGGERLKFLEHPQPRSSNERVAWNNEYYAWAHYEQCGSKGEHTTVHVSALVRLKGDDIGLWLKQLHPVLIGWDAIAFGTRFSIPKQ